LPLANGGQQKLSDLRGKVVILNFWATWCPPCTAEMPELESLYNKRKGSGLTILAVNVMEAQKYVESFMKNNGYMDRTGLDNAAGVNKLMDSEYKLFGTYLKQMGLSK
jgi:thiol-disulfide isomerase/thioredoxin